MKLRCIIGTIFLIGLVIILSLENRFGVSAGFILLLFATMYLAFLLMLKLSDREYLLDMKINFFKKAKQ